MLTNLFSKRFRVALPLLCVGTIGSQTPNSWADDAKPAAVSQADELPSDDSPQKPYESPEKDNQPDPPESDTPTYHNLAYQHQDSPLVYRFELVNRVGIRDSRKIKGNITYSFSPKQPATSRIDTADSLVVNFQGSLKATVPFGRAVETPLIQLGEFNFSAQETTNGFAELQPSGVVKQASIEGHGVDGLPWHFSTYPFPEMSSGDAKHWTLKNDLALVHSTNTNIALHFSDRRYGDHPFPIFSGPFAWLTKGSSATTGTLTLNYKRADQNESETVIEETIEFDGKNLQPQVYLTGSGTIRFDHKSGLVTSIQRKVLVKLKGETNETSYPVEIDLTRLEGEALQAYQKEEKRGQQRTQRAREEYRAKMAHLPTLADRNAVIELLKNGNDQTVQSLIDKMIFENSLMEDREVGKLFYLQLFKTQTGLSSIDRVIKVLAPDLLQSTLLAQEYRAGFDIGLTGDVLKQDTKLVRGQIICYPKYSQWAPGTFYASADDVVVLRVMDREQKLIVFLKSDCRLPLPQFIDPTTITLP